MGFTAQLVSDMVNCARGLYEGARNTCIQNRTSAARMKRVKRVSTTNATALVITSILSQRVAELARTLRGRLHRLHEMRLDAALLHHAQVALGGTSLGGDLGAQHPRILAALDREPGRAHERPEGEGARGGLGEAQRARRLLQRLDGIENI